MSGQGNVSETAQPSEGTGQASRAPELGRLRTPFPVNHCSSASCPHPEDIACLNDHGAYLYKDFDSGKLVVFCGDCARHVELNHSHRFRLVAL